MHIVYLFIIYAILLCENIKGYHDQAGIAMWNRMQAGKLHVPSQNLDQEETRENFASHGKG